MSMQIRKGTNMITIKRTKTNTDNKSKNYDYLTIEEITGKYENYHDSVIIHNGHVVGFTHE